MDTLQDTNRLLPYPAKTGKRTGLIQRRSILIDLLLGYAHEIKVYALCKLGEMLKVSMLAQQIADLPMEKVSIAPGLRILR